MSSLLTVLSARAQTEHSPFFADPPLVPTPGIGTSGDESSSLRPRFVGYRCRCICTPRTHSRHTASRFFSPVLSDYVASSSTSPSLSARHSARPISFPLLRFNSRLVEFSEPLSSLDERRLSTTRSKVPPFSPILKISFPIIPKNICQFRMEDQLYRIGNGILFSSRNGYAIRFSAISVRVSVRTSVRLIAYEQSFGSAPVRGVAGARQARVE